MDVFKPGINISNGYTFEVFITVQTASKKLGYCDQYLRKMLPYDVIQGKKIGQSW